MQVTQAPFPHQQTLSQITASPGPPQPGTGSSSQVIQQSSHRSPLQNPHSHFASRIEHFNDLPEREQWMGNSGTIVISSGVQQLPFPISKKVTRCLPLPWPETASDPHYPGYQTPAFKTALPLPWCGFSINNRSRAIKRQSLNKANTSQAVEYEKRTGGVNQRWKLHRFPGCCLFPSHRGQGKVRLSHRRGMTRCPFCKNDYQACPLRG